MKLWAFCELFYGRKPVETLCLKLQNQQGVNVGLVIWMCWHAAHHRFLDANTFAQAKAEVLGVHQALIDSLRSVRKSPIIQNLPAKNAISSHVLAAEILLEKTILEQLEANWPIKELAPVNEVFGLSDYLRQCQVQDVDQATQFLYANASACITQ